MSFTSEDFEACFSNTYLEARCKFLATSSSCGAHVSHVVHPMLGLDGEELATDIAMFGRDTSPSLLVLVSGTHGVEGFLGSAIQIAAMKSGLMNLKSGDVSVALVHALNPCGFSQGRRVNEANVDINRNFIDFSRERPPNEQYTKLHNLLMLPPSALDRLRRSVGLLWHFAKIGPKSLQSAVTNGQYSSPEGLFYGGDSVSWSRRVWDDIIKSLFCKGRRVLVIDYHTGLGKFGQGEIICPVAPGRETSWFANLLSACFDQSRVKALGVRNSVATAVRGDLLSYAARSSQAEIATVFHEFGTLPPLQMLEVLAHENWAFHNCPHEGVEFAQAKLRLRQAFCPAGQAWRSQIWRQVEEPLAASLEFLASKFELV